jgi:hypothetical protein
VARKVKQLNSGYKETWETMKEAIEDRWNLLEEWAAWRKRAS